jgi:hypothetical protein
MKFTLFSLKKSAPAPSYFVVPYRDVLIQAEPKQRCWSFVLALCYIQHLINTY